MMIEKIKNIYSYYNSNPNQLDHIINTLKREIPSPKEQDLLPNFHISSTKGSKFCLIKLPKNDPRALIMGKIVHSCISIGTNDAGRIYAKNAYELADNGFYVLLTMANNTDFDANKMSKLDEWPVEKLEEKEIKIIGAGYVWNSYDGNFVIDSWENLHGKRNEMIVDMLKKLADHIIQENKSITRVTIGISGQRVIKQLNDCKKAIAYDIPSQGYMSADAMEQVILKEVPIYIPTKLQGTGLEEYIISNKATAFFHKLQASTDLIIDYYATLLKPEVRFCDERYKIPATALYSLDNNVFLLLRSLNAIKCYQEGYIEHNQIMQCYQRDINISCHKIDKLKTLISDNAIKCYEKGYLTFDRIKYFSYNKLWILTSDEMIELYRAVDQSIIDEVLSYDEEKLSALSSKTALECYAQQYVQFDWIRVLDDPEQINVLTSRIAFQYYARGHTFNAAITDTEQMINALTDQDIKRAIHDIPAKKYTKLYDNILYCYLTRNINTDVQLPTSKDELDTLFSDNAIECYNEMYITFQDFKDLNTEKIRALTSNNAVKCYCSGWFTLDELLKLELRRIEVLTSDSAVKCYERLYVEPCQRQIKEEKDLDIIAALLSKDALSSYDIEYLRFAQIRNFSVKKIEALTSQEAYHAYDLKHTTFSEMQKFSAVKIRALTSDNAIECYDKGYTTFSSLANFDIKKIQALTSDNAMKCYTEECTDFSEMQKFSAVKIRALTSDNAIECYDKRYTTFSSLANFDIKKIQALTSDNAIGVYDEKYTDLSKLKDFDIKKIQVLTSENTVRCCKEKYVDFFNLIDFSAKKIRALTSDNAIEYYSAVEYDKRCTIFSEMRKFSAKKIRALTSGKAIVLHYTSYIYTDLANLKDSDTEKVRVLTSDNAMKCYDKRYTTPSKLAEFDIEKIQALTSDNAIKCYEEKDIEFICFINFEIKKIKALKSDNAIECYEKQYKAFSKLAEFDIEKIQALTSDNAIKCYAEGHTDLFNLIDFNAEKIRALTSDNAIKCYAEGYTDLFNLIDFNAEKIQALTSNNIMKYYAAGYKDLSNFVNLDVQQIQALTSDDEIKNYLQLHACCVQIAKFSINDNFDIEEMEVESQTIKEKHFDEQGGAGKDTLIWRDRMKRKRAAEEDITALLQK